MSSLFSTDPFPTLHSPSSYDDSSDLSVLRELEMEYGEPVNPLSDEFLTPEQDYASPLSDASIPSFTVTSPYDPIPTPTPTTTCVKTEITHHHIPIIPFQSVTATRTAKKRRRFVGMTNLRGSDDDTPMDDNNSVNSSDSLSSQSSPIPAPKKTTNKRAKANTDPTMGKRERNKVSASKYRQRRKMYLDTLEERTHELEAKYATQQETMSAMESENRVLKEQLSFLKNLLNGKGQDMATLEKQLHDGFQSTSNPQQSSSIFMFVLFSCFLLFNPMSWFSSTTTLGTNPVQYEYGTSSPPPGTTGRAGRGLFGFHDESVGNNIEIPFVDTMAFMKDEDAPDLSFLTMDTYSHIQAPSTAVETRHNAKQKIMAPTGSVPMAAARLMAQAPVAVPKAVPPASSSHVPVTGSPHDLKDSMAAPKASYAPLTGAPRDLPLHKKVATIDMDDPIPVHRVAQPVEPQPQSTMTPTAARPQPKMAPTTAAPVPPSVRTIIEMAPTTATPVPPSVRTIIDLTNTSTSDNNTSQRDMHKMAHDQIYVPLVRIMGETQAQHALQQLAQGVMNIQLENQTETRSGLEPQAVPA